MLMLTDDCHITETYVDVDKREPCTRSSLDIIIRTLEKGVTDEFQLCISKLYLVLTVA